MLDTFKALPTDRCGKVAAVPTKRSLVSSPRNTRRVSSPEMSTLPARCGLSTFCYHRLNLNSERRGGKKRRKCHVEVKVANISMFHAKAGCVSEVRVNAYDRVQPLRTAGLCLGQTGR